jgi:putative ATP-binding cassette transporter
MNSSHRNLWQRIVAIAKPFWVSTAPWNLRVPVLGWEYQLEEKWKARSLLGALALLLLSVNMLNVTISFVSKRYGDALQAMDEPTYWHYLYMYAGVFVVGTPIVVYYAWVREKLGVVWRKWVTEYLLAKYFENLNYYKVNKDAQIDNPDERIANDVAGFVNGTLGILLAVVDSIITFAAFIFILWGISPKLVGMVIVYAGFGTVISVVLSFRLIKLNFNQQKLEADYRYNLIHVRNNVESIAFYQGEGRESRSVLSRFWEAIGNYNLLIGWQRNVGLFTKGYEYMVIIVPALIIAPLYFQHKLTLGDFNQAGVAFSQVLGALSIVVAEVKGISSLIAYVNRLGGFLDAIERPSMSEEPGRESISTAIAEGVSLKDLTLLTPNYERVLVKGLNMSVPEGSGAIIKGHSGCGKSSILRAIAGLWRSGSGVITHPEISQMMFLPQRPYMVLGSLRDQILYPTLDRKVSDDDLKAILETANLPTLVERFPGGLDAVLPWADTLSLGEQQRLAFARLLLAKPRYAILDEATSALDVPNEERLYELLKASGTTFISVGHRPTLDRYHSQALTLLGDGAWTLAPVATI